jgi:hypothetical protein
MEMVLRLNENIHAPYYALTTVGPAAMAVQSWWDSKKQAGGAPRETVAQSM